MAWASVATSRAAQRGEAPSAIVSQPLLQARSGDVRRDDVAHRPDRAGFEQGNQIGMIQPAMPPAPAQEPPPALGPGQDLDPRHLQRHPAPQERVFGQVNHAEASATQLAQDREPAELPGYSRSCTIVARPDLIEQTQTFLDVEIGCRVDGFIAHACCRQAKLGSLLGSGVGARLRHAVTSSRIMGRTELLA